MDEQVQQQVLDFERVFRRYDDIYRSAARAFDIPELALWVLYAIHLVPDCTQKDIAAIVFHPKQSIHSALKQLVADGYIRTECPAHDRRQKVLRLTDKGEQLAAQTADLLIDAERRVFQSFPEEERNSFMQFFHRLTAAMDEELRSIAASVVKERAISGGKGQEDSF